MTAKGFDVIFTQPQDTAGNYQQVEASSWYYKDNHKYGSGELGKKQHPVATAEMSSDGKTLSLALNDFTASNDGNLKHSPRVYLLRFNKTPFGQKVGGFFAQAYYTIQKKPE